MSESEGIESVEIVGCVPLLDGFKRASFGGDMEYSEVELLATSSTGRNSRAFCAFLSEAEDLCFLCASRTKSRYARTSVGPA